MDYVEINARAIDRWVENQWEWGQAISHEEYEEASNGKLNVKLTPGKFVPHQWLGDLKNKKILGLASGGGQQMPIFSALGAECTVLDCSKKMLEQEKIVSEREKYHITIVESDMTKVFPFDDEQFDIIFHPISNCYVEEVKPIWKECYRVLKTGGVLLAGFNTDIVYALDSKKQMIVNTLPFNPLKNPDHMCQTKRKDDGIQFSHTLEEQINGQLEAGFTLTNLYSDIGRAGNLYRHGITTFVGTRSLKV